MFVPPIENLWIHFWNWINNYVMYFCAFYPADVKMMSDVELAELRDDPLASTSRVNVVHSCKYCIPF